MALKIFFDSMSQPSRSVLLFLKCNDIAFTPALTKIAEGQNRSEEFLKVNPLGQVPAMKHGDFCLFESVAILRYVCANFKYDNHWYPTDVQQRAKVDEFLEWQHNNLRMGAAMTFREKLLLPFLTGQPPKDVTKWLKIFKQSTNLFDNYFLANTKFISNDEMTIADLLAMEEFVQLECMGSDAPPLTKKIETWLARCKEQTAPHYEEIHKIHAIMTKTFQSKL